MRIQLARAHCKDGESLRNISHSKCEIRAETERRERELASGETGVKPEDGRYERLELGSPAPVDPSPGPTPSRTPSLAVNICTKCQVRLCAHR
jgi:hypothetical protein